MRVSNRTSLVHSWNRLVSAALWLGLDSPQVTQRALSQLDRVPEAREASPRATHGLRPLSSLPEGPRG